MSNSMKGIISGFVATVVLSIVLMLKVHMNLVPEQYSLIVMLSKIAGGVPSAWADHFIIGVLVWGLIYSGFDPALPSLPHWFKGLMFGVIAWVVAMVAFLPFVGAGLFGSKVGLLAAVVPLIQHLIYGLVLGITFGLLSAWVPAKAEPAATPRPNMPERPESAAWGGPGATA
jgi:hypothetical protein